MFSHVMFWYADPANIFGIPSNVLATNPSALSSRYLTAPSPLDQIGSCRSEMLIGSAG